MASNSIFITAADARQNPIRERVVFDEGTAISSAILEAVRTGYYSTIVDGGTVMTQNVSISTSVVSIDDTSSTYTIPNHPYNTGDAVYVNSTGELPGPLLSTSLYFVIFVDQNQIQLAATKKDALAKRPIRINLSSGVSSIVLNDQGNGYTSTPSVNFVGGNAAVSATALAYLATYGDVAAIGVGYNGTGYHYVPTVSVVAQGSGTVLGSVHFGAVAASVQSGGSNYRVGDILTVTGGVGTAVTATVIATTDSGIVEAVQITASGDYTTLPNITAAPTTSSPAGGTGCTLLLTMGIIGIDVITPGTQYTAPPRVLITGGGGTGATALANISGGGVASITVTAMGMGYDSTPAVSVTSGSGAQAIACLQPTGIGNVTLTYNGGNTYTSAPSVSVVAAGSGATVGTVYMRITAAAIATGGAGSQYNAGDTLVVAGGAGSASATIRVNIVDAYGSIVDFTLITSGQYTALPIMTNNAVFGGSGQAASFNLQAGVGSIALGSAGSDYTAPPTVLITANDITGAGAAAYTTLSGSAVGNVYVSSPGSGYTALPTVVITSGSNATVSSTLTATGVQYINVTNPGSGYTQAQVSIIADRGINAVAVPVIVAGQIVSITVSNQGYGYITTPTVIISGDGAGATAVAVLRATSVDYLTITNFGSNYTALPAVSISGTATANVSLYSTGIASIQVTAGGENYTSNPQVNIIPDARETSVPMSPTLNPLRGFSVARIDIQTQGQAYTSAPQVVISPPNIAYGNTAVATATIGYGTGTMNVTPYAASRDYYLVWQNGQTINPDQTRPYADQMDTVINYFANLGYVITRQTNPATNNTLQWNVKW